MDVPYQDRLKCHLSRYKAEVLGIADDGIWSRNRRPYSHILPAERKYENLLAPYREDLCRYLAAHREISLHPDFHHLNSSQAMCFNLFFPLAVDQAGRKILTDALGHADGMAPGESWCFEKVLDPKENTSFDFLFQTNVGTATFCEIKLSESGFGTAKNDAKHREKLTNTYRPRLSDRVSPVLLEEGEFFPRYQLCRNFSYVGELGDLLFVVYPSKNTVLTEQLEDFLEFVNEEHRERVKAVLLEDLVPRILALLPNVATRLQQHYRDFAQKYLLP
jgi:hypothetical protein